MATMDSGLVEHDSFATKPEDPYPTIEWFATVLEARHRYAGFVSAAVSLALFIPAVIFIQSSLYHPFYAGQNAFYLFFSTPFWFSCIIICLFTYSMSRFLTSHCFNSHYETNFNVKKYQVNTAAAAMFIMCFMFWILTFYSSTKPVYTSWTTFVFFIAIVFFASWQMALSANFRWQCTKVGLIEHLKVVIPLIFKSCAIDVTRNIFRGFLLAAPFCMLHRMTRPTLFDFFLAPGTICNNLLLTYLVHCLFGIMFEITNVITMQPFNLPLICPFTGTVHQQSRQKSMIAAIASNDDLLRLFGFRALHDAVVVSASNRAAIYALSQPGQKPRTWVAVYDICQHVIESLRQQLQLSTSLVEPILDEIYDVGAVRKTNLAKLGPNLRAANTPTLRPIQRRSFFHDSTEENQLNGNWSSSSDGLNSGNTSPNYRSTQQNLTKTSKTRLFRPPTLNPRQHVQKASSSKPIVDLTRLPMYPYAYSVVKKFGTTFLKKSPTVSSYYLALTEYSLQILSTLAFHSMEEDKYGVVQQNIVDIFGSILRLELAVDLFIRSMSSRKLEQAFRPNLQHMEDVLVVSLRNIYDQFRNHIDELHLTESERKMLQVLTSDLPVAIETAAN